MQKKLYKEMTVKQLKELEQDYYENLVFHQTVIIDNQRAFDYQQRIKDIKQELGQRF